MGKIAFIRRGIAARLAVFFIFTLMFVFFIRAEQMVLIDFQLVGFDGTHLTK